MVFAYIYELDMSRMFLNLDFPLFLKNHSNVKQTTRKPHVTFFIHKVHIDTKNFLLCIISQVLNFINKIIEDVLDMWMQHSSSILNFISHMS